MEQGWIYVLVNSSIPGMAKVGRTARAPADRAAELSGATGVATPFVLAFDQPVADSCGVERAVHAELDRRGLRVAPNREFFRGSPSEIVRVVLDAAEAGGSAPQAAPSRSAAALLAAADRCLFGLGDALQDTGEALRLYKMAASRGEITAFERLGQIHCGIYVARRDTTSRRRAMTPLKEGARRGNFFCYAEMAALFAAERHTANFTKAWGLFFNHLGATPGKAGVTAERVAAACCRYIDGCLELGLAPAHRTELADVAEAIVAALLAELRKLRGDDAARLRVARALRWSYQALSPAAVPPSPRQAPARPAAWLTAWLARRQTASA